MNVYYSTRYKDGGTYKTSNAEIAYKWYTSELFVIVHNWKNNYLYLTKNNRIKKIDCPETFDKIVPYLRKGYKDESPKTVSPYMWGTYPVRAVPIQSQTSPIPGNDNTKSLFALQELEDKNLIQVTKPVKKTVKKKKYKSRDLKKLNQVIPIKHNLQRLHEHATKCHVSGGITTLYHGTDMHNVEGIIKDGFSLKKAGHGMLGKGVYLGKLDKARNYSNGIILVVKVFLGNCKKLTKIEDLNDEWNKKYDSMHLSRGDYVEAWSGRILNDEWIVRDPELTEVVGIILKTPIR